jgi:hypothetical protein
MGKTSRTSLGIGGLRALNLARPLQVTVDDRGIPTWVHLGQNDIQVVEIVEVWKIEDGWWRVEEEQVRRLYFELILANGSRITIYLDLVHETWHEQRA